MSAAADQVDGVPGLVNYVCNAPIGDAATLTFVTEDEPRSTMITLPPREVWITNGRTVETELDREGFVLVDHVSSVDSFDRIQEDPDVDRAYIKETATLLASVTGAERVVVLGGGKKRFGESAVDKLAPLANAKPARYPHADNTDAASQEQAEMVAAFVDDLDLASYGRFALYNLWRTVSSPPQDVPLAVCDARTVRPEDEITVTAITEERGAGTIVHDTVGYRYAERHRWHYFPDMTRDEVIIFKAYDSDPARPRRVPHTAFDDPTCPDGIPTRASVEMRALALFT